MIRHLPKRPSGLGRGGTHAALPPASCPARALHAAASQLSAVGVPIEDVTGTLNHRSVAVTGRPTAPCRGSDHGAVPRRAAPCAEWAAAMERSNFS